MLSLPPARALLATFVLAALMAAPACGDDDKTDHQDVAETADCEGDACAQNRAPELTPTADQAVTVALPWTLTVAASDPDGDVLTFALADPPAGLEIDPASGLLQWTPQTTGVYAVTITVTDPGGLVDQDELTITVVPAVIEDNDPPTIAAIAAQRVEVGTLLEVVATASDPDGDPLAFSFDEAPAGMSVAASGLVSWVPAAADVGAHDVSLRVSDGRLAATTTFVVTVTQNRPPELTPLADTSATVGQLVRVVAVATDPDLPDDTLRFRLLEGPVGLAIDGLSGAITWAPAAAQLGSHVVGVEVRDRRGASDSDAFEISVGPAARPPHLDPIADARSRSARRW